LGYIERGQEGLVCSKQWMNASGGEAGDIFSRFGDDELETFLFFGYGISLLGRLASRLQTGFIY
jgi:hypothetical protein